jgi:rubrerythrin
MNPNKITKLTKEVKKDNYRMIYRCYNCGIIFEHDVPKGTEAEGSGGKCPICGVMDNKEPQRKRFLVIKNNDDLDKRDYRRPLIE